MKSYAVYLMIDPTTKSARYVGMTSSLLCRRRSRHIQAAIRGPRKSAHHRWLVELSEVGLKPELIVIERHNSREDASRGEIDAIAYFRSLGCDLNNSTRGGEGPDKEPGFKLTDEHRKNIRLANLRRSYSPLSDAAKANIRAGAANRKKRGAMSAEHRAKIAAALAGKKKTEAHRAALSASRKTIKDGDP